MSQIEKPRSKFSLHIQSNIIFGLFIVIPLWLTLFLAYYVFIFIADITYPIIADLFLDDIKYINNKYVLYIISFILSVTAIYFIGILARMWLGRTILGLINNTMLNIPIIGTFYKSLKQLTDAFSNNEADSPKKVVLINFPSEEMKTIGFIIKTFEDSKTKELLASVYVPTTPNPTSGYLEIVPVSKTIALDWSFEEAMSFIISGGSNMPLKDLSFTR